MPAKPTPVRAIPTKATLVLAPSQLLRQWPREVEKFSQPGKLKKVINKSKVVLDVKPWDDETDLKAMEAACRTIVHPTNPEAIEWQASGLEDIGYGIKKLRIMCQVIDDDVSVDDDIVEVIQGFDDYVQSCDIFAFNKV